MKNLKKKTKKVAIGKILFAIIFETIVIVVTVIKGGEDHIAGVITCLVLWTLFSIGYFLSGINTLKNHSKLLNKYLKESNVTMQELEVELKDTQKIGNIYIGKQHVFSNDSLGIIVIPITSINKLEIAHLGYNYFKNRQGYYYLYIHSSISEQRRKIYSITKNKLSEAAIELSERNNSIECINI